VSNFCEFAQSASCAGAEPRRTAVMLEAATNRYSVLCKVAEEE
jgi:hypothetical protein